MTDGPLALELSAELFKLLLALELFSPPSLVLGAYRELVELIYEASNFEVCDLSIREESVPSWPSVMVERASLFTFGLSMFARNLY